MKVEQLGTLATIVVAFAALAALVLTGQAGLRQDLRAMQTDMLAGQAELRSDMLAGQAGLRKEMLAGQAGLRKEMLAGQAGLRKEMLAGQAGLRKEMLAGQAGLRAGQARLRQDLAALGVRLAVVEHRTDALETRFAESERQPARRSAVSGSPAAGPEP